MFAAIPIFLRAQMFWADAIRRREEKATWLSGVGSGGKNHSLMIGIAGAGYGLLRAFTILNTRRLCFYPLDDDPRREM